MTDVIYVAPGRHQTFHPQAGVTLQLLHGAPQYQAFLLEVEPDTRYHSKAHEGEEFRYVLSGEVTFDVGDREFTVPAGGTLRHPSSTPHGFRTGAERAVFITFALARGYDVAALFRGPGAQER